MRYVVVTLEVVQDDKVSFFQELLNALARLYSQATFRTVSIEFRNDQ